MIKRSAVNLAFAGIRNGARVPTYSFVEKYKEQAFLADILNKLKVNCVFDVGANIGLYSDHIRKSGFSGNIFSFEPIEEEYKKISKLAEGDPKWIALNYALGNEIGEKQFNIVSSSEGSVKAAGDSTILSSFLTPTLQGVSVDKIETVQIQKIDAVFDKIMQQASISEPRVYLKIDTQGFDLEVIRGALNSLPNIVGIQCEMAVVPLYYGAPRYTEVLNYIENLGFSLMELFLVNRTAGGAVETYDCVMARTSEL